LTQRGGIVPPQSDSGGKKEEAGSTKFYQMINTKQRHDDAAQGLIARQKANTFHGDAAQTRAGICSHDQHKTR